MSAKSVFVIGLCMLLALSAKAQGSFNFSNYVPAAGINAPIYDVDGVTKLDTTFKVDFVYGPVNSYPTTVGLTTPIAIAGNGYFFGGKRTIAADQNGTVTIVVRAWGGADTYEAACQTWTAKVGTSDPVQITLATGNMPQPNLFGLKSFHVYSITAPEPTTIALDAMGLALFVFRRRK